MTAIVFPVGGRKVEWAPRQQVQAKKDQPKQKSDMDLQIEALTKVPSLQKDAQGLMDLEDVEVIGGKEAGEVPPVAVPEATPPAAVATPVDVPAAKPADAQAVVDAAQDAADAAQKVVEVAEQAAVGTEEKPADKAEDKPAEDEGEKDEVALEIEIPGVKEDEDKKDAEVEKESSTAASKEPAKKVAAEKSAATDGKFVRLSALSPQNRKDLVDYWKNMLGFPSEYVDAMVKDYKA